MMTRSSLVETEAIGHEAENQSECLGFKISLTDDGLAQGMNTWCPLSYLGQICVCPTRSSVLSVVG